MSWLKNLQPSANGPHVLGWSISLVIHGLAVGTGLMLVSGLELAPQPEPFRWQVSVVESSSGPASQARNRPQTSQPTAAIEPDHPRPAETHAVVRTARVYSQPPTRTRPRVVREPVTDTVREVSPRTGTISESRPIEKKPLVRRTKPIQHVTAQTRPAVTKPIQTRKRPVARHRPDGTSTIEASRPIQHSETVKTLSEARPNPGIIHEPVKHMPRPSKTAVAKADRPAESLEAEETTGHTQRSETSEPLAIAQPVEKDVGQLSLVAVEASETFKALIEPSSVGTTPALFAEPMTPSLLAEREPGQAMRPLVASRRTRQVLGSEAGEESTVTSTVSNPVANGAREGSFDPRTRPVPHADYRWLAEDILRSIDLFKHYPYVARVNHWEGRVVLRAAITADGHVVDLGIAESSGHPVLDEDAMEMMRQASPLKLKHDLGQPEVVVKVPINYKLD
ncbi:MAG: TonB family protein [Nitrospiraceae bacterium]